MNLARYGTFLKDSFCIFFFLTHYPHSCLRCTCSRASLRSLINGEEVCASLTRHSCTHGVTVWCQQNTHFSSVRTHRIGVICHVLTVSSPECLLWKGTKSKRTLFRMAAGNSKSVVFLFMFIITILVPSSDVIVFLNITINIVFILYILSRWNIWICR